MAEEANPKYLHHLKMAWIIYSVLAVVLATVLVLFVATDNEERFFYGMMTIAAAYVLRPTEEYFGRLILKYTGVSKTGDKT